MIRDVQSRNGFISREEIAGLAALLNISAIEAEGIATFYHFFSLTPRGRYTVYLNNTIISHMKGRAAVARAFEEAAGCRFGETSGDGLFGLFETSCIGMSDQGPSAVINGVVFTRLTEYRAKNLVAASGASRKARAQELGAAWPGAFVLEGFSESSS